MAKTTTAASLAVAWANRGLRVLLVDLDPQACLTFSLGYDPETLERSVHQVLTAELPAADAVVPTDEGPDLLPATIELARAEQLLLVRTGREQVLKAALAPLAKRYDVIVLDCPPTLGVLTITALTAATAVVIPLQCETLSHRGVGQLLDTIYDVRRLTNRRLRLLGVLPTLYDGRTAHGRLVLERIGADYGVPVIQPPVPKSIRFAEAPAQGRTVLSTARSGKGAAAYRAVADSLLPDLIPSGGPGAASAPDASRPPTE